MLARRFLGCLPEQHHVAHDLGRAVGADVAELLGAHVCHRVRKRRHHEREPLGDPAGMDAGAVQRDATLGAGGLEVGDVLGLREHPADRRHEVLARAQDARDDLGIGEDGRVDHAVGVDRERLVDVGRRGDADRLAPDELADVAAVLGRAVYPAPDELELGMRQHALDRGAPDATRRPLDHAVAHADAPA